MNRLGDELVILFELRFGTESQTLLTVAELE